jgi:hypothetical protein
LGQVVDFFNRKPTGFLTIALSSVPHILVEQNWPAILRVAAALEQRVLREADIDRLIAG